MDASRLELFALDPTTSAAEVERAIERARREGSAGVVVPPVFVKRVAAAGVAIASVVAYPHGWEKPTVKAIAATSLAKDGAVRLAVTPNVANLIAGDVEAYRQELLEIARGARAARASIGLIVRLDLDWGSLDLTAIGIATIRGAFDGVVLTSTTLDKLIAGTTTLRAIDGLNVAAIAGDEGWIEPLLAAGTQRVGICV